MGDYSSELQPEATPAVGVKKTRWAKWLLVGLVVLALLLILILILAFALKFNCPKSDSDGEHTGGHKKKGHDEPAEALKFLYVSDFHLDPLYKANVSAENKCREVINATAAKYEAPYGRIGCDSSQLLVEKTLGSMRDLASENDVAFFLFTGMCVTQTSTIPKGCY